MIIAIDGPAGSGKSTISKRVARELGFTFLDTGAMYRAITYGVLSKGIDLANTSAIIKFAESVNLDISVSENGKQEIVLDGEEVSSKIRTPEVTRAVKHIAKIPEVRTPMVSLQQQISLERDIVVEGRDTTTVVFPDAFLKIYLDASPEERARRRFIELQEDGVSVTYEEILEAQNERDREDTEREQSPLMKAPDAEVIETTEFTIPEVADQIIKAFKAKKKGRDPS